MTTTYAMPVDNAVDDSGQIPPPAAPIAAGKSPADSDKGGAPKGNRNAYRHGLYSPRGPKGSRTIDRAAGMFRRHLEDCTLAAYGEISILHASLIQTASEAARVALAEFRELCTDHAELKSAERTSKRQAALKALDLRDRKVKELGITFRPDAEPTAADPWSQFDDERRVASLPDTKPASEENPQ